MNVECQKYQSQPKNGHHQRADVYMYKQQYQRNGKVYYCICLFICCLIRDSTDSCIHIPVIVSAVAARLQDML